MWTKLWFRVTPSGSFSGIWCDSGGSACPGPWLTSVVSPAGSGTGSRTKRYLQGLQVEEVVRLARQCYREDIAPRVSPAGLACVLEHQAQGHAIALLSGSLALLLAPLQEELGADWLIATELQRPERPIYRRHRRPSPPGAQ